MARMERNRMSPVIKPSITSLSFVGAAAATSPPPVDLAAHPEFMIWWLGILSSVLLAALAALLWAGRTYINNRGKNDEQQWSKIHQARDVANQALDEIHNLRAEHDFKNNSPLCAASNPDRLSKLVEDAVEKALSKRMK